MQKFIDFLISVMFIISLVIFCINFRDFVRIIDLYFPSITWWDNNDMNSLGDKNNAEELSDITVCYGDKEECEELVEYVEDLLPDDLEEIIYNTTEIEIITGDYYNFRNHMKGKAIDMDVDQMYVGITGYGYKKDISILYSMADEYTLLHELGHAYEYSHWYEDKESPSQTQQWKFASKHEYITDYGETDIYEFYAECFAYYFLQPEILQERAPVAYELMNNDFNCY